MTESQFPQTRYPQGSDKGPEQNDRSHLKTAREISVEGHPLKMTDPPVEPTGWKGLNEMPRLRCSQRPGKKNGHQKQKDLPEGAHAGETNTQALSRPSTAFQELTDDEIIHSLRVPPMRGNHEWMVKDDDGVKREIRVIKEAGLFRFQTKRADAAAWTYFDNKKTKPAAEDVASLIEVLERKYQRKRTPYSDLLLARKMLSDLPRRNQSGTP